MPLRKALQFKKQGNELFKKKDYRFAITKYSNTITYCKSKLNEKPLVKLENIVEEEAEDHKYVRLL